MLLSVQDALDPELFLSAMSRYASGVTLVTTTVDGEKWGFTASSFSSVSADPPLVLVCLDKGARSFRAFQKATHYAIHLLSADQSDIAMHFARKSEDKFSGLDTTSSRNQAPILSGFLTLLHCRSEQVIDAGDHIVMIGRVEEVELGLGEPLVYFDRSFGSVRPAASSRG